MTTHDHLRRDDGDGRPDGPPDPQSIREVIAADPLNLASHRNWDGGGADPVAPPRRGWALARLVLVVAAVIAVAYAGGVGETVLLVLALVVCIVLHELGHFATAKSAGMKVTEFFVGFGPTLWSVQRGETTYGVKALPLGGYCRIIGMHNLEEVDPADEARTYRQQPLGRRLSVAVAGSAMHFLIALVVLFAMFAWTGDTSGYLATPPTAAVVGIDRLSTGPSPAQAAGFRLGDRIVSIDGRRFATYDAETAYIRAHAGRALTVVVDRAGRQVTLRPTPVNLQHVQVHGVPASALPATAHSVGFIGIESSNVVHSGVAASVSEAGGAFVRTSALTLDALGRLVTLHGVTSYFHMLGSQKAADTTSASSVRFSSPVGVVRLFHTATADGLATVLYLLALVNISLGLFNLVPLLPLDGGHVAIAVYEGARSRRRRRYHADVGKLLPLLYLAIGVIVFLGVTSLYLDVRDLVA